MCVWYRNTDANIADRSQKITPPVINYVKWQRWKLWKCRAAAFYRGGQKSQPRSEAPGVPLWRWQQRSRQPRAKRRSEAPAFPGDGVGSEDVSPVRTVAPWLRRFPVTELAAKMSAPCEASLRGSGVSRWRSWQRSRQPRGGCCRVTHGLGRGLEWLCGIGLVEVELEV